MEKNLRKYYFVALFFCFIFASDVYATDYATLTRIRLTRNYLQPNLGSARSIALGDATTAAADGSASVFLNPANFADMSHYHVSASYAYNNYHGSNYAGQRIDPDNNSGRASVSIPIVGGQYGSVAIGYYVANMDFDNYNDYDVSQDIFAIGWGGMVTDSIGLGLTFTYRDQDQTANTGYDFDANVYSLRTGLLYKNYNNFRFGLSAFVDYGDWDTTYAYAIPGYNYYEGDILNLGFSVGVEYEFVPTWTLAADFKYSHLRIDTDHINEKETLNIPSLHLGIEKRFSFNTGSGCGGCTTDVNNADCEKIVHTCGSQYDRFDPENDLSLFLRAGANVSYNDWNANSLVWSDQHKWLTALSAGAGITYRNFSLDYAFAYDFEQSWTHLVTLGLAF